MICLLRELVEPWGAGVSSELPAVELPREQCGTHPSFTCCMSHLLLSQGVIPLFLPCYAFPGSGVESWCSLGRGSEDEGLIGILKDAAT